MLRTIVDDREETISEYICDWPNCPNVAMEVIGFARELRLYTAFCAEHVARIAKKECD
jgi:hypothetical protein